MAGWGVFRGVLGGKRRLLLLCLLSALLVCGTGIIASRLLIPRYDESDFPLCPNAEGGVVGRLGSLGYLPFVESESDLDALKANVTYYNFNLSYPGVNMYVSKLTNRFYAMSMNGNILHVWSSNATNGSWIHGEFDDDGSLYVICSNKILLMKLNPDSGLSWLSEINVHHDLAIAENKDIYVLAYNSIKIPMALGLIPILDDNILVLSSDGKLKKRLSVYELFGEKIPPGRILRIIQQTLKPGGLSGKEEQLEAFHTNTIDILERDIPGVARKGNLLICVRNLNLIAIVDVETEKVVWRWGEGELDNPHTPIILDNGNILVFDNGPNRCYSRVVEVNPALRKIVWEYKAQTPSSFFSKIRGDLQLLPNGNMLVTESDRGHAFEVTREGRVVWDFWNPEKNQDGRRMVIYRMNRVAPDFLNKTGISNSPA